MVENIDSSLIDWSRAQFALTAIYHWLFVPLTLGLGVINVGDGNYLCQDRQRILEKYGQVLDEIIWH